MSTGISESEKAHRKSLERIQAIRDNSDSREALTITSAPISYSNKKRKPSPVKFALTV